MKRIIPTVLLLSVTMMFLAAAQQGSACQIEELKSTSLVYPTLKPIEGRVVDESGWPVVGAVVLQYGKPRDVDLDENASLPPYSVSNRVTTDVRGKFKLGSLDHKYPAYFQVIHPDYATKRLRPLELFGDIVLAKGTDISGRVLNHDGTPARGAKIELRYMPDTEAVGFEFGKTETDEKGRFVLPNVTGSSVRFTVTIPDELQLAATWYPSDENSNQFDSAGINLVGDDVEIRLPQPTPFEISALSAATGEPVPIERVHAAHTSKTGMQYFGDSHFDLKIEGNRISNRYLRDGINRIWIHPKPDSKHLSVFVDFELQPDQPPPEKIELKIPEGVLVSGKVVDEIAGRPIANVAVQYLPLEPGRLLKEGIYFPKHVRTEDDGTFSFVAPAVPAWLQVVGDCKNFRSLPVENARVSRGAVAIPEEVSRRLERNIEPIANEDLSVPAFKLSKAPIVSGVVLDENDQPLANTTYVVQRSRETRQRTFIFGKTDQNGRFEIENVFTNALREDLPRAEIGDTRTPNTIFFWHEDRTLGKRIVLNEDELSLTVKLELSPAAWGRVVDKISKEPVAGVHVMAMTDWMGIFYIGAITRDDGTFLLEHLARQRVTALVTKHEYNQEMSSFSFPTDEKKLVLELDDIEIIKTFAFGKPDKPVDISNLPADEALKSVTDYLAAEFRKLPPGVADIVFSRLVTDGLTEQSNQLFDDRNSPEFQTRAALAIFELIHGGRERRRIPFSPICIKCQEVLVANIDRDGVFEKFRFYDFGFGDMADVRFQILKISKKPDIRKWAIHFPLSKYPSDLRQCLQVGRFRPSDEQFKKALERTLRVWQIGLTEFPDEVFFLGQEMTTREYVERSIKGVIQWLDRPNLDEARGQAIREALDELQAGD